MKLERKLQDKLDLINKRQPIVETLEEQGVKAAFEQAQKRKLEDDETGDVHYTNIACRLFDDKTCSCGNYPLRKQMVAGCVVLTPENIERNAHWMPSTCAYRLLEEGGILPDWHPLITGNPQSVQDADISMHEKTVAEYEVNEDDFEDYVIEGLQ